MRLRYAAVIALAVGALAGLAWWRRRGGSASEAGVQLGLADGSVLVLDPAGPAAAELERLARGVRDSMTEHE